MSSWARVGVKCQCVDDRPSQFGECSLLKGKIYTITAVLSPDRTGRIGVLVAEAVSKSRGFHLYRFRPLITKTQEQDVSMFLSLLKPSEVNA